MRFLPRILNPLSIVEGLLHSKEQRPRPSPAFLLIPPGLPRRRYIRSPLSRVLAPLSTPIKRPYHQNPDDQGVVVVPGEVFSGANRDSTRSLNDALSCPPFISEFRRPLSLTPHPLSSGGGLHDLLISDTERASSPCTSNPPFEWWSRNPTVSTIRPNHHRPMGRSAPKPAPDPSPSHRTACRIGVLGALDGFSMGAAYDVHFDTGGAPRCPRRWKRR